MRFERYIGIDYSGGAQTPESSVKGLRIYMASPSEALEVALSRTAALGEAAMKSEEHAA